MTTEEVVHAPNWLRELEAKREQKLKARLGHEAGAGSPCLECKEQCPGLDLHFWRKICKNCKCGKENHGVNDSDVSDWLQFQLLGSKPKQTARIRLPGANELELEWAPRGTKEAVERYLKDLPTDRLPVKGSAAARERKQLLQKQMPFHDIDPSLCHNLSEEEAQRMREYVGHLKETSVGVGQLLSFRSRALPPPPPPAKSKHDYENIDAFGNHKLAASLEAIRQKRRLAAHGELVDEYGNPARALYAMLLDKCGAPLKDPMGKPVKAALDLFGHPIFDAALVEKIAPVARAEYAILLDRNGAPILGGEGHPTKRRVAAARTDDAAPLTDKFGNEVRPHAGLLLDRNGQPVKDQLGAPVKVRLDVYGRPVFDKALSELFATGAPKFVAYLEKSGAPIVGPDGAPATRPIGNEARPRFAVFLDGERNVLRDRRADPVASHLDAFGGAVVGDAVLEDLNGAVPAYCVLLDERGDVVGAQNFNAHREKIVDKFDNEVPRPRRGLLLDEHECAMKDAGGAPIEVALDAFLRAAYEPRVVDRLGGRQPAYVMFLDGSGAAILDKYGSPVKNVACATREPPAPPRLAILLDKHEQPLTDAHVDALGRPLDEQLRRDAAYAMPLDADGVARAVHPIAYLRPSTTVRPQWSAAPRDLLKDKHGAPLRMKVDVEPTAELPALPPVVDKYGNLVDPRTGRPMMPHFAALNLRAPTEELRDACVVNVGAISDVHAAPSDAPAACHRCRTGIDDNAVVVQIERSDALWHTGCFRCKGCNQSLADLLYHYHAESDDVYCGRDYAKVRGMPRCHACDELIFVKEYCLTEDMTYHVKHFCCFECDTPLAGQDYVLEHSQQPVCIGCYELLKADRCTGCGSIIKPNEQGANLNGDHFHASDACFACAVCAAPLLGGKFLYRNRTLYCSAACFNSK